MPRKGERMSDQQRAKIAAATLARWARGEPNPMAGRRHTEATRQRMRQARQRKGEEQ
jgi:hypothetical protein